MKLKLTCARCGRYLGEYNGEPFILSPATPDVEVVCEDCWKKLKRRKQWRQSTPRTIGEEAKS